MSGNMKHYNTIMNMIKSIEETLFEYWKNNENLRNLVDDARVVTGSCSEVAIPFVRITTEESQEYCPTCCEKSPRFAECCVELHHNSFPAGYDTIEQIQQELNFLRIPIGNADSGENIIVAVRFLRSKNICKGVNHWVLSRKFRVMF